MHILTLKLILYKPIKLNLEKVIFNDNKDDEKDERGDSQEVNTKTMITTRQ